MFFLKIVSLSLCELIQSFGLLQTSKQFYFLVHPKNYGRIEIVGILLARLKYMSGSENIYMQIIGLLQKTYILKIIIYVKLFLSS